MQKFRYLNLSNSFILILGVWLLVSCQKDKSQEFQNNYPYPEAEINQLKIQINELEELINNGGESKSEINNGLEENINSEGKNESEKNVKTKSSPIKSITFRMGSKDDRLRIYWEDGSKTDLPCTKEQSIWACG